MSAFSFFFPPSFFVSTDNALPPLSLSNVSFWIKGFDHLTIMSKCCSNCRFFSLAGEGVLGASERGRDVTRQQQQQPYVNVWQTWPFKIKQCTETRAYHYSLHMLQWSTAVDAVCTKKPDGFKIIDNPKNNKARENTN